ncbi:hypothetical protein [Pseudoalteromonas sp. CR1]|uniref:hypothetical protein n=1 Tax=Pseudoalteromonas sp. CR1 TaxID=2861964 RepID=UPI002151FA66|nr:hypothetical protein [Pseudoalteromonas sp. CR1]
MEILSEKIVTTDGAARLTASEKLKWLALIALGIGTLGSNAALIFGLKNTTKKAILRPANRGGRTNLMNFSTSFLLLKEQSLYDGTKKITAASATVIFITHIPRLITELE